MRLECGAATGLAAIAFGPCYLLFEALACNIETRGIQQYLAVPLWYDLVNLMGCHWGLGLCGVISS